MPQQCLSHGTSDEVPDGPNQAMTSLTCYCSPRTGEVTYPRCVCPFSWNLSHQPSREQQRKSQIEATVSQALHHHDDSETSQTTELKAVQNRKKLSAEDFEHRSEQSVDENQASSTLDPHETSQLKWRLRTNGGDLADYKKLWEEAQKEISRLRSEMEVTRQDLDSARQQLVSAKQVLVKTGMGVPGADWQNLAAFRQE